jgi:hypothetical protein
MSVTDCASTLFTARITNNGRRTVGTITEIMVDIQPE